MPPRPPRPPRDNNYQSPLEAPLPTYIPRANDLFRMDRVFRIHSNSEAPPVEPPPAEENTTPAEAPPSNPFANLRAELSRHPITHEVIQRVIAATSPSMDFSQGITPEMARATRVPPGVLNEVSLGTRIDPNASQRRRMSVNEFRDLLRTGIDDAQPASGNPGQEIPVDNGTIPMGIVPMRTRNEYPSVVRHDIPVEATQGIPTETLATLDQPAQAMTAPIFWAQGDINTEAITRAMRDFMHNPPSVAGTPPNMGEIIQRLTNDPDFVNAILKLDAKMNAGLGVSVPKPKLKSHWQHIMENDDED